MRFEDAVMRALHFTEVWGVRCVVYGYKRSGRWQYGHHPTFQHTRHSHQELATTGQAPKTQDLVLQS